MTLPWNLLGQRLVSCGISKGKVINLKVPVFFSRIYPQRTPLVLYMIGFFWSSPILLSQMNLTKKPYDAAD